MASNIDDQLTAETSGVNIGKILISKLRGALAAAKSEITALQDGLAGKADAEAVNLALAGKADAAATTTALSAKADLVAGKVPASQLPSYIDDVLEFANLAGFPATGETSKIYVDLATNKIYRWSGSVYIEVSAGGGASADYTPVAFSNLIDLSGNFVHARTTISGALALAPTGTPKVGAEVIQRIVANGTNMPDFSAFKETGNSSGFMNVANQDHLVVYTWDGTDYLVTITTVGTASVDSVAPVLSTATIFRDTPNRIDILFSEEMLQLPTPLPASFALTGAGSAGLTITGAAYTGTRGLRLTLSGNAPNAGVINLAYNKPASGSGNELKDLAGNLLATFGATAVTNNSEVGIALQYPNFGTVGAQLDEVVTPGASSTYTVRSTWTSGSQTITQSDVFIPAGTDGFIRAKVGRAFQHFGIGANSTATLANFNSTGQILSMGAGIGTAITNTNLWKNGAGTTPSETSLFAVLENDLIEFRRINSGTTPEIQLRGSHDNGNTWVLIHRVTADTNIAAAIYPYLYTGTVSQANLVLSDLIIRG